MLEKPTCEDARLLTNFYRPAFLNSFSQINIINNDGESQVDRLIEVRGREDDGELCLEADQDSDLCNLCSYEFNGRMINSVGSRNKIQICALGSILKSVSTL